jgi:putative membrane protein
MTDFNPGYLLNAIVYSILGIIIFSGAFTLIDKMTPYDLWKEICENRNTALAIMIGAMSIGVCIIIAAAVH